ncbi:MAG: PadR family transcriptional regulator [Bacteroidota bacterium]
MANTDSTENVVLELRRGVIVLAVLSQLGQEQYGYSLLKLLADRGLEIDQGTLYPLLRRLEAQGLLQSVWKLEEARPRRYYVISSEGKKALPRLIKEWAGIVGIMDNMLTQEERKQRNETH